MPALSRPDVQRLEPKTFLASERTFLSWLHMAITLGSIGAALLAFAANSKKSKSPMHTVRGLGSLWWAAYECAFSLQAGCHTPQV